MDASCLESVNVAVPAQEGYVVAAEPEKTRLWDSVWSWGGSRSAVKIWAGGNHMRGLQEGSLCECVREPHMKTEIFSMEDMSCR